MHVSSHCDQACGHCSVWRSKGKRGPDLGLEDRVALLREARTLGARAVLFTGGEPFLCDHLEALARAARGLGLSVQVATNGLGLSRAAPWLADCVDEIYVSVEGPEDLHDGVRGPGMFSRLRASIAELHSRSGRPRLIGRSVVSARNGAVLDATVSAARSLGLDALSFLPVDVTSGAFGGDPAGRASFWPGPSEVAAMRASISRIGAAGDLGAFVIEDVRKLFRMADDFLEESAHREAPACTAPEWSSVVEADGAIRPCFFQPTVASGNDASLRGIRRSAEYAAALRVLGRGNALCRSCVCPKRLPPGGISLKEWAGSLLARPPRPLPPKTVSAA